MKIGDVSSTTGMYGASTNQKPGGSDSMFNQSVTLAANTPIDLGTFAGKPLEMQIFNGGGYEWSGAIRIQEPASGSQVTPEQAAAAYAAQSYTEAEYSQGQNVTSVVELLYLMNKGTLSTDEVNSLVNQQHNITPSEVTDALTRLGINSNEPFTVNGQKYSYNPENNNFEKAD